MSPPRTCRVRAFKDFNVECLFAQWRRLVSLSDPPRGSADPGTSAPRPLWGSETLNPVCWASHTRPPYGDTAPPGWVADPRAVASWLVGTPFPADVSVVCPQPLGAAGQPA